MCYEENVGQCHNTKERVAQKQGIFEYLIEEANKN